jgi:hypothetical protein
LEEGEEEGEGPGWMEEGEMRAISARKSKTD